MRTVRSVAEVGVGLLYAAGAMFNAGLHVGAHGGVLRHVGGRRVTEPRRIVHPQRRDPQRQAVQVLLILFQVTVAVAILSRGGAVKPALLAGGAFALVVAFFSSPGGTVGNLLLAAIQFALAPSR